MPKIVILTGGISSGKTTVSSIFKSFNIKIVDTDIIASRLTGENGSALKKLKENFGSQFFKFDGSLDKKKMRIEIFSNYKEKLKIENILHPMIAQEVIKETETAKSPYVIHVVPLWVEKNNNLKSSIWKLVVVDCCESIQRKRAMLRSKIDALTFNRIKSTQVSRLTRLEVADCVINNDGSLQTLRPQVSKIHNYLLNNV